MSPYVAMGNNPISIVDPDGDLFWVLPNISFDGGLRIGLTVGAGPFSASASYGKGGFGASVGVGYGPLSASYGTGGFNVGVGYGINKGGLGVNFGGVNFGSNGVSFSGPSVSYGHRFDLAPSTPDVNSNPSSSDGGGGGSLALLGPTLLIHEYLQTALYDINFYRLYQSKTATMGVYSSSDGLISGSFLEPKGPSTKTSGLNQRIPAGQYQIVPHNGKRYKGVYKLYNADVPVSRAILIHAGNTPSNTKGCILPGCTSSPGEFIGSSRKALSSINGYIKSKGHTNIRVNMMDAFGMPRFISSY